jgi:hypothetical protein
LIAVNEGINRETSRWSIRMNISDEQMRDILIEESAATFEKRVAARLKLLGVNGPDLRSYFYRLPLGIWGSRLYGDNGEYLANKTVEMIERGMV